MPWEEEMRQIDDPVRLRRRAANLERELAVAPARESTLPFLREEVRFALDSPLERDGFEPSVPRRKRRGAYRRYKDLLVRRGPLERWYDFYNNAEESFAGVVRGETCLRS